MGQDPEAIRQDIERQRDEMSETIDAIGYKADVPARTKEAVSDRVDAVKEKVGLATSRVSDATPSSGQVKGQAKQAVSVAKGNPLGLAIGAIGVGFLAGLLIPETAKEHEALGSVADKVKGNVADTAQEALEHGKQVAQETASAAKDAAQHAVADVKDTAQSAAQEHGQQVKETAQENAQDAASQVKDEARSASPTAG
jgi:gas vesicle protein